MDIKRDVSTGNGGMSDIISLLKIFSLSAIGVIMFFFSIEISGKKTIPIDHITSYLVSIRPLAITLIVLIMLYGAIVPYLVGSYKFSIRDKVFSAIKVMGLILGIMYLTGFAPKWAMSSDMLPFLFEKLALSVGLLIPIGAIGLTFLISFGLLEFASVFLEKLMRPLYRTPGASSIDAVASFVGSYSIGLLITDRAYKRGRYSHREAVIIATGFSTVSATFMIIVAKTLGLMDYWNFYFWSTLFVTFNVTSITVYLPPISFFNNVASDPLPEPPKNEKFKHATQLGITQFKSNPNILQLIWLNLKDGLAMSSVVAPSILAIGFIGLTLSKYTPIFEWIGIVLKPFLWLTGFEGAIEHSGAMAAGLAEMFLPSILLKDADIAIRYMAAVTTVGSVLFFSGSIPCILATSVHIKIWQLIVIWFIRTVLCLLLSSVVFRVGLMAGWIV